MFLVIFTVLVSPSLLLLLMAPATIADLLKLCVEGSFKERKKTR